MFVFLRVWQVHTVAPQIAARIRMKSFLLYFFGLQTNVKGWKWKFNGSEAGTKNQKPKTKGRKNYCGRRKGSVKRNRMNGGRQDRTIRGWTRNLRILVENLDLSASDKIIDFFFPLKRWYSNEKRRFLLAMLSLAYISFRSVTNFSGR